jgi:iron complex outermembrane receptor protein
LQDIRYLPPIPQLNNGILQFKGDDPVTADSAAAFGTLMFSLTDALSMTAGIRYTEESKRYEFVRLNWDDTEGAPIVDPLNGLVSEYEGEEVDYRLSLDYRFSDGLMVYSSFSTGFKGGGVAARPFTPGQAINGAFDAEAIEAFEFGVKSNPLQNSTLNLAVFWNDYQDRCCVQR